MGLFHRLHDEKHTIVIVTHDPSIAARCPRAVRIVDGKIVADGSGVEVARGAATVLVPVAAAPGTGSASADVSGGAPGASDTATGAAAADGAA